MDMVGSQQFIELISLGTAHFGHRLGERAANLGKNCQRAVGGGTVFSFKHRFNAVIVQSGEQGLRSVVEVF